MLLKEFLNNNFLSLSLEKMLPIPENTKVLRGKTIQLNLETNITKHTQNTFNYVTRVLLKIIGLDSFNLTFNLYKLHFNENKTKFFNDFINNFNKFNISFRFSL